MMKLIKQGCFTNAGLSLVVGVLSIVVTAITGREVLSQVFAEFQQGTANLLSTVVATLTNPVSIPMWVFFLLTVFVTAGSIKWLSRWLSGISSFPRQEWVNFRGLFLAVEWDKNQAPHVVNRSVEGARCGHNGDCWQDIIGSDRGYGWVNYLRCRDGHYVGNDKNHEDFVKEQEAKDKQAEIAENEKIVKLKQQYEQLLRDKEAGKITQEEFEAWEQQPADSISGPPYYFGPNISNDDMPARDEREFYSRLVNDYEREAVRKILRSSVKSGT